MAKQSPMIISGKLANLIFYNRGDKSYVRTKPKEVRQTAATKASAGIFKSAVKVATILRHELEPVLPLLPDQKGKRIMYTMNTAVQQWMLDSKPDKNKSATKLTFIDQLEFNPASELNGRLKRKPLVDWQKNKVLLTIPALNPAIDIAAPAGTETVLWKIMTATATVKEPYMYAGSHSMEIEMKHTDKMITAQTIELPVVPKAGEITVLVIALQYKAKQKGKLKWVEEERWLPAAVAGSCYGKL